MKTQLRQICGVIALVQATITIAAEPSASARLGRALFQGFTAWSKAEMATINGLPTEFSACARCHGPTGGGRTEAGVTAPSLVWSALTKSSSDTPAYKNRAAVWQAIEQGVGRGGRQLGAAMPRFNLSNSEKQALLDYLQILGSDADQPPGVTADAIRVGALLPLQGPSTAIGAAVQQGLRQAIDTLNQGGGIYGRRLDLIVYPVAADAETVITGVQQLVTKEHVYSLVASFTDLDTAAARQRLQQGLSAARIADIASLSQAQHKVGGDQNWRAPLLPSIDGQLETLRQGLRQTCPDSGEDWLLTGPDLDLSISGAKQFNTVSELMDSQQRSVTDSTQSRTIISVVAADATRELAERLRQWWTQANQAKLPSQVCIGYLPFKAGVLSDWPAGWIEALVSPLPRAAALEALEQRIDIWVVLGRWAGQVLIEALAQAGPHLYERALLDALPALNGRELRPGVRLAYRQGYLHGWEPTLTLSKPVSKLPSPV